MVKHQLQTPGEQPQNSRCGRAIWRKGGKTKEKENSENIKYLCHVEVGLGDVIKTVFERVVKRTEYTSDSCSLFTH